MGEVDFATIKTQCENIVTTIKQERENLIKILIQYQPYNVAEYEIDRCIRTLKNIDENRQYFKEKVGAVSMFMPSNLPLYSLLIFALIPGFIAEKLYIYPNKVLRKQKIIQSLHDILQIKKHLPNIEVFEIKDNAEEEAHDIFIELYVKKSQVVIFTGRNETKNKVEKEMPNDSILIYNGSGHNPIVVTKDADVNKAVEDSIFVKFFNSGQDCAGPDSILVHKKVAHEFIDKFKEECSKLTVSEYSDKTTFIGPIHQESELDRLKKIIDNNKDNVVYGGKFNKNTGHPTIISSKITEKVNFKETFGPIAFIVEYEKDEELKLYFQDKGGRYQYNKMYVSLYGNSRYIKSNDDITFLKKKNSPKNGVGIVLYNQTIHDAEIGTKAYGGYSKGASAVICKNSNGEISKAALPILIPEIITELLINKKSIQNLIKKQNSLVPRNISDSDEDFAIKIELEFKQQVENIFGKKNIEFAFIFGSIAKRTFKKGKSDIDTFICLKTDDESKKDDFKEWIISFQYTLDLKPDSDYPSEIVAYQELESAVENLEEIKMSFSYSNNPTIYDKIFWACILPSFHKKKAFVGGQTGGGKLYKLVKKCRPYPKKWGGQFIELFDKSEEVPASVQKRYPNLDKKAITQKLNELSKKNEYCEIMRLVEFDTPKTINTKTNHQAYVQDKLDELSIERAVTSEVVAIA